MGGCPTSTTVLSVQTCGRRLPERTGLSLRRRHQGTEEAGRAEPDSLDVLHPPGEGVITYNWDLSIGLKLP